MQPGATDKEDGDPGSQLTAMHPDGPTPVDQKALLERMGGIPRGLEAAGYAFSILKETLHLHKAAMLLNDAPRDVFAPWALCGFDETTARRLRLPVDLLDRYARLREGEALVIERTAGMPDVQELFSSREYDTLERIVILPFCHQERLVSLLLVADSDHRLDRRFFLEEFSQRVAPATAEILSQSRDEKLPEPTDVSLASNTPLREEISQLERRATAENTALLIVRMSIGRLVEHLCRMNTYIEKYRLRQDLLMILGTMISGLGRVRTLDPDRVLFLVHEIDEPDGDLLVHQVSGMLAWFFPEAGDMSEVDFQQKYWIAGDESGVEDLLSTASTVASAATP